MALWHRQDRAARARHCLRPPGKGAHLRPPALPAPASSGPARGRYRRTPPRQPVARGRGALAQPAAHLGRQARGR
eukprot:11161330-Lingulodinium_polyedra.AAC.1